MIYSKTTGKGKHHIIFAHGNSQSHQVWDEVVNAECLKHYTRIALDLPGHGKSFRSEHPATDYTLRGMALHLQDFANQYSDHGYIMVANSLATNYIAEKAYGYQNCKGVFLTGASIIGENITPGEIIQPNPNFGATFSATATEAELNALIDDEAYHMPNHLREQLKALYRNTDPNLRTTLGLSIANQEYTDEIGNLWKQNIPIAVVNGADDKLTVPDYMKGMGLKMWRDRIIIIPEAGHCCHLDEPELIANLVAEFASECFK
ncbi:alpha/beta fold hydrolase [Mucilaginibacter paludis]|uniref:Alpha/beta hydrolase fold containing protein n=1 Tax=Mucilaginibacter paludis DSM 18603 TaxID=714943 RepID=H1Y7U2_9SPHI|nr:alpha/beta hydrolase [Mucilaginibacter paludis]EHQ30428.1 alpha/beta hydrolase fold containing protein [Mucilaginibacter paludis DSM 18603]